MNDDSRINKQVFLPDDAPISRSIFESGFYYDGRYVKYRSSFWESIRGYSRPIFHVLLTILSILTLLAFLYVPPPRLAWLILLVWFPDRISNVITFTISPSTAFDIKNKTIRVGRFFVACLPFDDVQNIEILNNSNKNYYARMGIGTHIKLMSASIDARITLLHPWEATKEPRITNAILSLIGRDLPINYVYLK